MRLGTAIVLLALGAILAFAIEFEAEGIDLNTVGIILMIVGAVGILLSMMFWSTWGGFGNRGVAEDRTVVRDREVI